jgi:hypothetical protein
MSTSWAWWHPPIIPAFRRLRPEDCMFEDSYIVRAWHSAFHQDLLNGWTWKCARAQAILRSWQSIPLALCMPGSSSLCEHRPSCKNLKTASYLCYNAPNSLTVPNKTHKDRWCTPAETHQGTQASNRPFTDGPMARPCSRRWTSVATQWHDLVLIPIAEGKGV